MHARNTLCFSGIHKIVYTYRTLVTYMNCACSFHINKGVTADSLLGKAVSCAVYVVKATRVQGEATTKCVQREISISVAALNGLLW